MIRKPSIYFVLIAILHFVACSPDDVPNNGVLENKMLEVAYSINSFNVDGIATRATDAGTTAEQQVDNLYLLLFDGGGANPKRYFIDSATFTGGTWDAANRKITLSLTQAEAGNRQVYVVANISAALKTTLDGVATLTALKTVAVTNNTPWSPGLTTLILMSGNATHNFVANRTLSTVSLIRALAKVELNITLPAVHQDANPLNYKYKFIDFDKKTYVLKPDSKPNDLVNFPTTGWQDWQQAGVVASYGVVSGKVATLKIVAYLNERNNAGSYIDIQLPYNPGGPLPPPEFGNDTFKLPLAGEVKRNHWYKYDVTL